MTQQPLPGDLAERYGRLLRRRLLEPGETELAEAQEIGRRLVDLGVAVEDVGELHERAIAQLAGEFPGRTLVDGMRRLQSPLIELLIAYGLALREGRGERERAMEELRQSEARRHAVVANVPVVQFALDREGIFTLSEGKGLETLNLKPGEVVGRSAFDLYADSPDVIDNLRRVFAGEPVRADVETGGEVFDSFWSPVFDDDGNVAGLVGVSVNITDRVRAERALRESEERFRTVIETAQNGIVLFDARGRATLFNGALCRMLGYTRAGMERIPLARVLHPDDRDAIYRGIAALTEGEEMPGSRSLRLVRKDGEVITAEVRASAFTEGGEPAGSLVEVRDVTEELALQRRVAEAAAEVTSILQVDPDAVVLADEQGIILRANPAACALFGWPEEELLGRNVSALVAVAHSDNHHRYMQHYRDTGEPSTDLGLVIGTTHETVGRRRDGTELPIELSVAEFETADGSRRYAAAIRDITERRRADEERRRLAGELAARSEERRRLVQRLLVAHEEERRQVAYDIHDGPAQQLTGADMLLETYIAQRDDPQAADPERHLMAARRYLGAALQETRRIMSDLRPAMLDDMGLVDALRSWLGEQSKLSGVRVDFDAHGGGDRLDPTTEVVLFRVAQEAVGNALKYSGSDRVRVLLTLGEQETVLAVRDWGGGFDPVAASRVREEGRRLGLVGMRERTELLGGTFLLDASPGRGTSITVKIPAASGAPPAADEEGGTGDD